MKKTERGMSKKRDAFIRYAKSLQWIPLAIIVALTVASFIYGWFYDTSKPHAGIGWADQSVYTGAANRLSSGELPTANQLHYSVGYPFLGMVGHLFTPDDPFMLVSLGLYIASMILCFLAFSKFLGKGWAMAASLLLLVWDGFARTFSYTSELFMIPWNNQVLFFAFAFFLWLFAYHFRNPTYGRVIGAAVVVGYTFLTREESILFLFPLLLVWLIINKVNWRKYVLVALIIPICYLPQVAIKTQVLGSVASSGRSDGYQATLSEYLQPSLVMRNISQTIVGDDQTIEQGKGRQPLFQAAPWLWLGLIGIIIIFASKKWPLELKLFAGASLLVMLFYLSGVNMSAQKLPFHCLRYISAGYILLNVATIITLKTIYDQSKRAIAKRRPMKKR